MIWRTITIVLNDRGHLWQLTLVSPHDHPLCCKAIWCDQTVTVAVALGGIGDKRLPVPGHCPSPFYFFLFQVRHFPLGKEVQGFGFPCWCLHQQNRRAIGLGIGICATVSQGTVQGLVTIWVQDRPGVQDRSTEPLLGLRATSGAHYPFRFDTRSFGSSIVSRGLRNVGHGQAAVLAAVVGALHSKPFQPSQFYFDITLSNTLLVSMLRVLSKLHTSPSELSGRRVCDPAYICSVYQTHRSSLRAGMRGKQQSPPESGVCN